MPDDRETVPASGPQADTSLVPGFTYEELEEELGAELDSALGFDALVEDSKRVFTLNQLCERYNCSRTAALGRAQQAVVGGLMEPVTVRRMSSNGSMRVYNAFRLLKK